jgi:hypothetical protein
MKLHVIVSIKLGREGGPWATSHYLGWAGVGKSLNPPILVGKVTLFLGFSGQEVGKFWVLVGKKWANSGF